MLITQKRKYVYKALREKCQSLKDLEKGLPNKDASATWVKSKEKLFAALEKGNNQRKTPTAPYWVGITRH